MVVCCSLPLRLQDSASNYLTTSSQARNSDLPYSTALHSKIKPTSLFPSKIGPGKVVGGILLSADQLLRVEQLTIGARTHLIDHSGLEIHHHAPRSKSTSRTSSPHLGTCLPAPVSEKNLGPKSAHLFGGTQQLWHSRKIASPRNDKSMEMLEMLGPRDVLKASSPPPIVLSSAMRVRRLQLSCRTFEISSRVYIRSQISSVSCHKSRKGRSVAIKSRMASVHRAESRAPGRKAPSKHFRSLRFAKVQIAHEKV